MNVFDANNLPSENRIRRDSGAFLQAAIRQGGVA